MARLDIIPITRAGRSYLQLKPRGYVADLYERTQALHGIRYDRHAKAWLIPRMHDTDASLREIFRQELDASISDQSSAIPYTNKQSAASNAQKPEFPEHWQDALLRTEECLRVKRYSWRTVKSYMAHLRQFFCAHADILLDEVDNERIRVYLVQRIQRGKFAASTQNQLLNAIKFWLEQVEGREKAFIDLRPKSPKKLPQVLSVEEVSRLILAVDNLKHRCILKVIYGGGLRLSELVQLRLVDIHSDRMQIFVHGGKGKKDRYTTLPNSLLTELRKYYKEYRPSYWLFEGQYGGQYSVRSVQNILKRAVRKSGVNPYATVHTLRHSYATHLLEQGTSLRHIQTLLGHANSATTELYTNVSTVEMQKVVSPLDRLGDM